MRIPALSCALSLAFSASAVTFCLADASTASTPATLAAAPDAKLPSSTLPLKFVKHEHIALVGNSLAERMTLFGSFEALLHARFPQLELVVRNFARPCDAVDARQRSSNYTAIDDPLKVFGPDTFLCFFGFNEAFAGAAGEQQFREAYGKYLDEMSQKYPRQGGAPPRFILISPIAWEPTGNPLWPDAGERNKSLRRYAQIVSDIARERQLANIDLYTPTDPLFAQQSGMQYTINGCHLNEAGDREVAVLLDRALFGETTAANLDAEPFQKLRDAVNDKSWVHLQDYRMLNGWYVYGGRRTWDTETFPREFRKIRAMAAVRDRYVWDIAQGKSPAPPDDRNTGELFVPPTRFGSPQQDYSEPEKLEYLSPEECIQTMKVPDGFEVQPFASEREFPELAKPDQINFDNRGRLWVCCMPTYPQWKPGDGRPNDRLIILDDKDQDGRADKCTVFYDKLHCPTGFEFWNGGVIVVDQPRYLWLKDTDGDDKADVVVHLFDGWASDDTHHTPGKFEYSHGGLMHNLEGIAMSTTVETPWGPHRTRDTAGSHVIDLRRQKLSYYVTPGYGNPWCYVFDSWGQGFVGDGTSAQQHWDSPLSGALVSGRRGMDPVFNNQGMRPCVGSEFLRTRQFPENVQGQFTYSCVINMNGMPRFNIRDESAGYVGERIMHPDDKQSQDGKPLPDDLLVSSDKNFRPVDAQLGPDGALWFGDWCNALIGHMQYSQRDPNRDHARGRIYRLVYTKNKLLEPVTQYGKSEAELLDQLREYEPRTRYRARRELRDRPQQKVLAAVAKWVAALDTNDPDYDRLRCEAIWAQQGQHAVDETLLREVLGAKTPNARAAAMHMVADEREFLSNALELLATGVRDENPRVRLEAVRGLSFFPSLEAAEAVLAVLKSPTDQWITYTLEHTLAALEPQWSSEYQSGEFAAGDNRAKQIIDAYLARRAPGRAAQIEVQKLVNPETPAKPRAKAYAALEKMPGDANNGRSVFSRLCASCHKVGDTGYTFGPDLSDAGRRLNRHDLIESMVEPSKKVDPKYVTTTVVTSEGKSLIGFVVEKTQESVTLLMAEGKQATIPAGDIDEMQATNQSSMPENLASTLSPTEFLDVIEYLVSRTQSAPAAEK
jgi:putative heme-binding domain-containing protein